MVVGLGRLSPAKAITTKPGSGAIDLLLAPRGTPSSQFQVAGKHARFYFDEDAILTLKIYSQRGYPTIVGNDEFNTGQRYFEYTDLDEEAFQAALRQYLINHLERPFLPPSDLSATPSLMHYQVEDWIIKGIVGNGSFGVVNVDKNWVTGQSGAAKCMVRNSLESHAKILKEIDLFKNIPSNPRLLRLLNEYYERGERWFTGIHDDGDERYYLRTRPEKLVLILPPFVRYNLSEALFIANPLPVRIAAFYQLFQGLAALHTAGYIHRDIKPANLGMVRKDGGIIEIVILDYGEMVYAEVCEPAKVGTIPFIAPEMSQRAHGREVDIWAAGIVGLIWFVMSGNCPWRNVLEDKESWKTQVSLLRTAPPTSVEALIAAMITWDSKERITA